MTDSERQKELQKLVKEARNYPVKGRYYVYERFKQRLVDLNPTNEEYEQTCRQLAIGLRL